MEINSNDSCISDVCTQALKISNTRISGGMNSISHFGKIQYCIIIESNKQIRKLKTPHIL